ncbi:MAG: PTS lactose/cellobiose transporter subunit IIA [Micrococcaceae bacterium]
MENIENLIFEIIVHSGNSRANLYEALDEAGKNSSQEKIDELLKNAAEEMTLAHNIQTNLIQEDLKGDSEISLLLIHAQDQLMTTMSEQTLIERMIKMQQQINKLKANN